MNVSSSFLRRLRTAEHFESVALATLGELIRIADRALRQSSFRDGSVLRAMLHLRPDNGYAGLNVLDAGATTLSDPGTQESLLPSASVWRRVQAARAPVAVDVQLRTARVAGGDAEIAGWLERPVDMSSRSNLRLLARDATHLMVLPVFVPGGLAGMISIEARCMSAMGLDFIWQDCSDALEAVCTIAGPYLTGLPRRPLPGGTTDPLLPVVGEAMRPIVRFLRAFAAEDETLLVRGETGTGKSRIARWIHAHSARQGSPFEVLDLLSVPETTQMGELFGWKRGAFTGAVKDHRGFVARANGGTLFIDEIDKLSMETQAALLTLLEDRRYRILGDDGGLQTADVRFVVGTNIDLQEAVSEGRFREDLYYRINVLPIRMPPLRERSDEIAEWAAFMLRRRHAQKQAPGGIALTSDAGEHLARLPWPGNLRQLDNVMRRAYTLASMEQDAELTVTAEHVHAATAFDVRPGLRSESTDALYDAMCGLSAALANAQPAVDLEAVDVGGALLGMLLSTAVIETGSRDAAFALLGRGALVKNRNHHKVLKREWSRLAALYTAMGQPLPAPLKEVPE